MLTKTFEYVPEFDMEHAIYDNHGEFYNAYHRLNQCDAASSNLSRLIDGKVRVAYSTHAAQDYPFTHFTTGELVVGKCDDSEKRGRYTFGGYDLTIISTTNDKLGAIAMKHMHVVGDHSIRITAASLNTSTSNDSKDGQTLLICHNRNRVYALRRMYNPEGETTDGVDLKALWEQVPHKRFQQADTMYFSSPTGPAYATQGIRVTLLERDSAYKDALAACVAWFKMEGKTVGEYRTAEAKARPDTVKPAVAVDVGYVRRVGFLGLTDYERARVATINAEKPMPRKGFWYYCLGFDSQGFFEEVIEKTKK